MADPTTCPICGREELGPETPQERIWSSCPGRYERTCARAGYERMKAERDEAIRGRIESSAKFGAELVKARAQVRVLSEWLRMVPCECCGGKLDKATDDEECAPVHEIVRTALDGEVKP